MKPSGKELDVNFIGGMRPLTKEDEKAISEFIKANKLKRAKVQAKTKENTFPRKKNPL